MMQDVALRVAAPTMTSREIAELVESRHDSVKRAIGRLAERGVIGAPPSVEYLDSLGRAASEYRIGKRDSYVIVAQLSPEFTARLVDRWQELEAQQAPAGHAIPQSFSEALRLAADEHERRQLAEAQRDEAIRTKALIGSKREATAMATASAARRETAKLQDQLGFNARHATIIAVERATGQKFAKNAYVELRRWCKQYGVKAQEVQDPRYGTVKAWPAGAWAEVFAIELGDVFGEMQS